MGTIKINLSTVFAGQKISITQVEDKIWLVTFMKYGCKRASGRPKKAWQRILTRAGIKDLRIHDLRRTLGSWQAATGATTAMIGKSLGHKSQRATAVYERLNIDPVRDSVERATGAMWELVGEIQ